jgi:hypothetical protein
LVIRMPPRKAWKSMTKAFSRTAAFLVALIAYASNRDWLMQRMDRYIVGYFEGICSLIVVLLLIVKYGDAISEVVIGIRVLGRRHKKEKKRRKKAKHRLTKK